LIAIALAAALVWAGPSGALPYEAVLGHHHRDTVLLLHGGGWEVTGTGVTNEMAARNRRFARWGLRMVSADYARGAAGLQDVLAVYDAERWRSPRGRICAYGASAGGHWALLLAIKRPSLDCVVSAAGPADLRLALRTDPRGILSKSVRAAFGVLLPRFDPWRYGRRLRAPTLLEYAENDRLVPPTQGAALLRTAPNATTVVLSAGTAPFVHSAVDGRELHSLHRRERALLTGG
jgi:dipeptidyl aminopeptidase/acylaminoacyl peptidase